MNRQPRAPRTHKPKKAMKATKVAKKSAKKSPTLHQNRSYYAMGQAPEDQPTIHSDANQPAQFGQSGHQLRVKKLYRKMLKDHYNWFGLQQDNWVAEANNLRDKFEQYRHLTDVGEIETVIKEAEIYLAVTEDPNPYRPLMHPQGGIYGRNEPPFREVLKPHPSQYVYDRDYHEEERVVRHLHAAPHDPDYAPTPAKYAQLKIKRGEYWLDNDNPATINPVVQRYCEDVGIQYMATIVHHDVSGDFLSDKKFVKVDANPV
jgi:hypothetical protein